MTEPTAKPLDVVSEESARQTVILVFTLAGLVLSAWVIEEYASVDSLREMKMRILLRTKRVMQCISDWSQKQADNAATAYQKQRL